MLLWWLLIGGTAPGLAQAPASRGALIELTVYICRRYPIPEA
jgi:hypothetical protein